LAGALKCIEGIKVYPSQANFILFKAPDANKLFENLIDNGVLIKNLANSPKLHNCLRVTVGTSEQNKQFVGVVKSYYGE
jgi:histidinol-phosphate aminotransferase